MVTYQQASRRNGALYKPAVHKVASREDSRKNLLLPMKPYNQRTGKKAIHLTNVSTNRLRQIAKTKSQNVTNGNA